MKWNSLINLKVGDIVKYKIFNSSGDKISTGIIKEINTNCPLLINGLCDTHFHDNSYKRCIGSIKLLDGSVYCGEEDGSYLIDIEKIDFIKEEEFKL